MGKKEGEGGVADCELAIKHHPRYVAAFVLQGVLKDLKSDLMGAKEAFSNAIALETKDPDVYYMRGRVRSAQDDPGGALGDYVRSVELNPQGPYEVGFYYRGRQRCSAGDFENGIADFSRAIELKPDFAEALYFRGMAKRAKGIKGYSQDLKQAYELKPGMRERPPK